MASMTDTQLLVLYNEALQALATGQSYQINDRRLTRADLQDVLTTIEWLEKRINVAADTTGGVMLVQYRDQE